MIKKNSGEHEEKDQIICYECRKSDHKRAKCSQLKKKKKSSKKTMKVTWDKELFGDSNDSNQFEEEVANVYLIALKDEFNKNEVKFSYNKILEAFKDLHH